MGNQLIIIGVTGTHNPALVKELVGQLCQSGLSVRHASCRYQEQTVFATGGSADLKAELEEAGIKIEIHEGTLETGAADITLDTINDNVLEALKILKRHEPKAEKAPKPPKEEKKKGPDTTGTTQPPTEAPPSSPPTGDQEQQEQAPTEAKDNDPPAKLQASSPTEA